MIFNLSKPSIKSLVLFGMIILSGFSLLTCLSCSKSTGGLTGTTWVLTYDPDSPNQPPDDMMVFQSISKVDLRDSKSVYLTCSYKEQDIKVLIECEVKGTTKNLDLTYSDDKNVLINPSGAKYTKKQ
jgi:hypothetical protein